MIIIIKFLDLQSQYASIREEVDSAIQSVLVNASFIGGAELTAFETEFAAFQGAAHCVGVGNGTDALEIALEALDLPPGAEVIVPANSFIASSEAVTRSGLRVVFADVNPDTYLLDLGDVKRRLTPRTKALVVVHLYGNPCDMDAVLAFAKEHGLRVIEDAAQAHGAEWRQRRVGAIGDIGTFSFYPGKNLGAYGDGGAILTNDGTLAKKARMIANHGRVAKYDHEFEGRNSRLDGLQATILRVKLRHLDGWIGRRNAIARQYIEGLIGVGDLILPQLPQADSRHAFHLFVVRTASRRALAHHLEAAGIQTGRHYPVALPKLAAYRYLGEVDVTMFANQADQYLLSLPIGEHLADEDVHEVIRAISGFFARAEGLEATDDEAITR
ncbi:DegT/DnrJ/EryC1/StrS aminotransferase family protein [Microbacterium sp.]|uniref:DegT/DnrJ/EryC1/StrS family aminotransferase n=1 Tax=Microbacterium sp. TaxID=51671 RepID=UPI002732E78F|nr:DegT/DnrJ/EryC1/StrS family aminotransferase [Microbacterium sp.]MDP3949400.1 DegT/DnrJ/EryC1/StrS family aminotransferase [Microbacterium sp.]